MRLWHYTCDHGAAGIRRDGIVRPSTVAAFAVAWFTDLETPDRTRLGLTSQHIACDRTAWRVEVDPDAAERWTAYARRARVPRDLRDALEAGRLPAHWWVSESPVRVLAVGPTR